MAHPNRGEVWLVDLGLAAKVRPCLVLSIPYEEEERSLVTAIAHTTSPPRLRDRRGFRNRVGLDVTDKYFLPEAAAFRWRGRFALHQDPWSCKRSNH